MKLLHLDSSVLGPHSVSRQVSAAIVERLRQANPGLDIVYRDLTTTPLGHLTGSHLAAGQGAAPEASLREDIAAGQAHGCARVSFVCSGLKIVRSCAVLQRSLI